MKVDVARAARAALAHRALERILARAVRADDPVRALLAGAECARVGPRVRRALAFVDGDGLRIAGLLSVRLRFERLLRACPAAERWFDRDPAGFALGFDHYRKNAPPTAFTPRDEERLFRRYLGAAGVGAARYLAPQSRSRHDARTPRR